MSQKEGSNYRFLLANFNTFVLETVLGKREILQFSQQEKRFEQMMDHQNKYKRCIFMPQQLLF